MDGPGPIRGRPRPLGWIIGGIDPMACEIVCSKLINLDYNQLPIVRTAKEMGLGFVNDEVIEIIGDEFPQNVCTDFVLAEPVPIRFSLLHVCKSVCKQMILLAKSVGK
jgi:uncharacterized protein (DUF362 family)